MEDYKGNSDKSKEKKVDKVISGKAKTKKKNDIQKMADAFVAEDAHSVKSYVLGEVVVPALKKLISDIFKNGIDMILYGESSRTTRNSSNVSRVNYRGYYEEPRRKTQLKPKGYGFDDIILETRGDAEAVLDSLEDCIDQYDFVSVGDLYDLVDMPSDYTDNKYGWTDLHNAQILRVRDGYLLKMPKARPI